MATISTSINTSTFIVMTDPGFVKYSGDFTDAFQGFVATSSNFSWITTDTSPGINDVDVHGSGFTYSGSGDARELASGTISRISFDIDNDSGTETQGDLVITGTEDLIASNIDKDDPRVFWNEVLKGDDVFILTGLAEADIGLFRNSIIFGDDLASATFQTPGVISDQGGDDLMLGADNLLDLIGDVVEIEGFDSGEFGFFPAEYDGGNDRILSAITDRGVRMTGDARRVDVSGILHGGNDDLDNDNSTAASSETVGDAVDVENGGTVFGGNDTIETASNGDVGRTSGDGDVRHIGFGKGNTVIGGDDVIVAHGASDLSGDVGFSQVSPAQTTTIIGGDDRISGSAFDDHIGGDVGFLGPMDGLLGSLLGGNDIVFGGAGNDQLYGEYGFRLNTTVSNGAVSGGDDQLDGGAGDDRLFGQTGDDSLNGGADRDRLVGGGGVDTLLGAGGNDVLSGGAASDTVDGAGGDDFADGGLGPDRLIGGGGNDRFVGRAGGDTLLGGSGNDGLIGGSGNDTQNGGAGADSFVFDIATFGADRIQGFEDGSDLLWFHRSVADAFSDLSIVGNGTTSATVSVTGLAGQSIVVGNTAGLTLTAADVVFYG